MTMAIYKGKNLFGLNSRGIRVHHDGEAQQQVGGTAAGAGRTHILNARMRQGEETGNRVRL